MLTLMERHEFAKCPHTKSEPHCAKCGGEENDRMLHFDEFELYAQEVLRKEQPKGR